MPRQGTSKARWGGAALTLACTALAWPSPSQATVPAAQAATPTDAAGGFLPTAIDLLDLPSAHVPPVGTLFASGLGLGWVPLERLLVGVDVGDLAGLNRALSPDPNARLRWSLLRRAGAGVLGETALELDVHARAPLAAQRTEQHVHYRSGRGAGVYIVDSVEVVATRWVRVWEPWTARPRLPPEGGVGVRYVYRERRGTRAILTLAQRVSLALSRGGTLSLHGGVALGLHAVHVEGRAAAFAARWAALPSYRLHAGVDIDLGRRVRLLASVRYDPDHWNALTRTPALGADTGVVVLLRRGVALQLHVQPGFVGLFWRG